MRAWLLVPVLLQALTAHADAPVWLELAPQGRVVARTIVEHQCPQISVNGGTTLMSPRGGTPGTPAGHRLVCEKDVSSASSVSIGGVALHLPPKNPRRIVVLGDTGCRIKVGTGAADSDDDEDADPGTVEKVQDCNDAARWPFAAVAAAAARAQPDLVIHVGDYLYRESGCPPDRRASCANSPHGDVWATWDADFFTPARPLLQAAPWVFIRGNHEICSRAGTGWTWYLDPADYPADVRCRDNTSPYKVLLGDFQAWVLDSSSAADADPPATQVTAFARQFAEAAEARLAHAWLLSHRPIWAAKAGSKGNRDHLRTLNATLEQAWAAKPIPGIELVVAGHTHLFELFGFKQDLPPQAVIGNGGTDLAHHIKTMLANQQIGTATIASGTALDRFGYALIEPTGSGQGWHLHVHDAGGRKVVDCTVAGRNTGCRGP